MIRALYAPGYSRRQLLPKAAIAASRVGLVTCGGCYQTPQNGIVGDGAWVNVGDNILQRYRGCPVG